MRNYQKRNFGISREKISQFTPRWIAITHVSSFTCSRFFCVYQTNGPTSEESTVERKAYERNRFIEITRRNRLTDRCSMNSNEGEKREWKPKWNRIALGQRIMKILLVKTWLHDFPARVYVDGSPPRNWLKFAGSWASVVARERYSIYIIYMYHSLSFSLWGMKPTGHKIHVQRVPFSKRFKPSPKQMQQSRYLRCRRVGQLKISYDKTTLYSKFFKNGE